MDADGNIYVANDKNKRFHGSVTMYLSGQATVWQSIETGITFPAAPGIRRIGAALRRKLSR